MRGLRVIKGKIRNDAVFRAKIVFRMPRGEVAGGGALAAAVCEHCNVLLCAVGENKNEGKRMRSK